MWDVSLHEVDAVKTIEQRRQIEAHLSERGQIYADIWKVGVNTAFRISDLLSLAAMEDVRVLTRHNLRFDLNGKLRIVVTNSSALVVMQSRLVEHPSHVWLFQSDA